MSRFGERTRIGEAVSALGRKPDEGRNYGVATGGTSSTITDGGYTWTSLNFTATASLTVSKAGLFDLLLVGGGGGGGNNSSLGEGGGGGSGGQVLICTEWLDAGTYTCTVGGAGSTSTEVAVFAGSSAIQTVELEAMAGVSGSAPWAGAHKSYNGSGASYRSGYGGNTGGAAVGVYGFNGGNSSGTGNNGGGGGAGGAGGTRTRGAGLTTTFTGTSTTFGEGGLGGGDSGTIGTAPTANRGGGGSGAISTGAGQNGAAGVVNVRFR